MPQAISLGLILLICAATSAHAACPAPAYGNTAEAIRANEQPILCLQREVADAADQRRRDMQTQAMQNTIQQIQLERRFEQLPGF